jgi:dUTP pyrophosphatase
MNPQGCFYATQGSAAFDIVVPEYTQVDINGEMFFPSIDNVRLLPNDRALVKTGLSLSESSPDECLLILSRSGLTLKHGVVVLNAPGLVDSDYADEIGVILMNLSNEPFAISPGLRIAQGLVIKREVMLGVPTKEEVRQGGFGSTGK